MPVTQVQTSVREQNTQASSTNILFSSTPTQGNEMFAFMAARPAFNTGTAPVLTVVSGGNTWDKIATRSTSNHTLSIFRRTAGASEATTVTCSATATEPTFFFHLRLFEFSGVGTNPVDKLVQLDGSGQAFADVTVPVLSSQPQLTLVYLSVRQSGANTLAWDAAPNRPAGFAVSQRESGIPFINAHGWEEVTSTASRYFRATSTASSPLVTWISIAATIPLAAGFDRKLRVGNTLASKVYLGNTEVNTAYVGSTRFW